MGNPQGNEFQELLCYNSKIHVLTKKRTCSKAFLKDDKYIEEVISTGTLRVHLNGIPTSKFVDKAEVSGGDEELIETQKINYLFKIDNSEFLILILKRFLESPHFFPNEKYSYLPFIY